MSTGNPLRSPQKKKLKTVIKERSRFGRHIFFGSVEERSRTMTKGATAVMGQSVRCILTITALLGALVLAGPVAQSAVLGQAFVNIYDTVDGKTVGGNNEINAVGGLLGALPTNSKPGAVEDGEDGWVNVGPTISANPGLLAGESVLRNARNLVGTGASADEPVIIANLQPGDTLLAACVVSNVSASRLDLVRAGADIAAATLINQVTLDLSVVAAQLPVADPAVFNSVFPNYVTGAYAYGDVENSTIALFVWDAAAGLQVGTVTDKTSIPSASFQIAADATTADTGLLGTFHINSVSDTAPGNYIYTGSDGVSTLIGIDVDGPSFEGLTGGSTIASDAVINYATDANGVAQLLLHGFADPFEQLITENSPYEFRAGDTFVFAVTMFTAADLDGEPDAYFGAASDPVNGTYGVVGSIEGEMEEEYIGSFVDAIQGAANASADKDIANGTDIPVLGNALIETATNGQIILSGWYTIKDIATPIGEDYGILRTTFTIGDELGLADATTLLDANHGEQMTFDRHVDTRKPYVSRIAFANAADASQPYPAVGGPGNAMPTAIVQIDVDLNGDALNTGQAYYIAYATESWTNVSKQVTAFNTISAKGLIDLSHIETGYGQIQGASMTTNFGFYDLGTGTSNVGVVAAVTDDARNFIVYDSLNPPISMFDGGLIGPVTPPDSTLVVDFDNPELLDVRAGITEIWGNGNTTGPNDMFVLPLIQNSPELPDSAGYTNIAGTIRLVTYGASGATVDLEVLFDPTGSTGNDTLAGAAALEVGGDGGDALGIEADSTTASLFDMEVRLGAQETVGGASLAIHELSFTVDSATDELALTILSSGAAIATEATVTARLTIPNDFLGLSRSDTDGFDKQLSEVAGGIADVSFLIKISDFLGNFDGGSTVAEADAAGNLKPGNTEFSNNIAIQTRPPNLWGQIKRNSVSDANVAPEVIDGQSIMLVTQTLAIDSIDPEDGLDYVGNRSLGPAFDPYKFGGATAADVTLRRVTTSVARIEGGTAAIWSGVQVGDSLIVAATISAASLAGDGSNGEVSSPTPTTLFAPLVGTAMPGDVTSVNELIESTSMMITADFSDFLTGQTAVVPSASKVVGGAADQFIGTAEKDDVVCVTFVVPIDPAQYSINGLTATTIRLVTVTARQPLGEVYSVGIYAATADFAAPEIALSTPYIGKDANSLVSVDTLTGESALVAIGDMVAVTGTVDLQGSAPADTSSDGKNTNFLALDMTAFGLGLVAAADLDVVSGGVRRNINEGGTPDYAEVIDGASLIYATWTVTLPNTGGATAGRVADITGYATSSASVVAQDELYDVAKVDLNQPDVEKFDFEEYDPINTNSFSGQLTDSEVRPGDKLRIISWFEGDAADTIDGSNNVSGYQFTFDLSSFAGDNLSTPEVKRRASSAINEATWTFTIDPTFSLVPTNPDVGFVGAVMSVTDQAGNDVSDVDSDRDLYLHTRPPQVQDIALSATHTIELIGPFASALVNGGSMPTNNADRGADSANGGDATFSAIPASGHARVVGKDHVIQVVGRVSRGESSVLVDDFNIDLYAADFGYADPLSGEDVHAVTSGGVSSRFVTWTLTIPDTAVFNQAAKVSVGATDTSLQGDVTVDNVTLEVNATGPTMSGTIVFKNAQGVIIEDVVSGISQSPNYATAFAIARADYGEDYPSTAMGPEPLDASLFIDSATTMISADLTAYGLGIYGPNQVSLTGAGEMIEGASTCWFVRNSTNTTLVAVFNGLFADQAGTAAVYQGTKNVSIPGYVMDKAAPSNAAAGVVLLASDKAGNQTPLLGSPGIDNDEPLFTSTYPFQGRSLINANALVAGLGRGQGGATITSGGATRVTEGDIVEIELGVRDPENNTAPLTVFIDLSDFDPDLRPSIISSVSAGAPDVTVWNNDSNYIEITGITPTDEATPAQLTVQLVIGDNPNAGDARSVTLAATDAIGISSLVGDIRTNNGGVALADAWVRSTTLDIDNQAPANVAIELLRITKDVNGNITSSVETGPSVAPGSIILVSGTYTSDSINTVATNAASKFNVGTTIRIDTIGTGYTEIAAGVYRVTAEIKLKASAIPIQPQALTLTVTDNQGNATVTQAGSVGINAVGVVINSTILKVNSISTANSNFGGIGPDWPDGVEGGLTVIDELTTGDRVSVTAQITSFDSSLQVDEQLTLDISPLYGPNHQAVSSDVLPDSKTVNPLSGVVQAVWTHPISDFDGALTNANAVQFNNYTGAQTQIVPPNGDFVYKSTVGNTTRTVPDGTASVFNDVAGLTSVTDSGYISVQASATSVTDAVLIITAQDSGALATGFAAATKSLGPLVIDTQPPAGTLDMQGDWDLLPSGGQVAIGTGDNADFPLRENGPDNINRYRDGDTLVAVLQITNPAINGVENDDMRSMVDIEGGATVLDSIKPSADVVGEVLMDLSIFNPDADALSPVAGPTTDYLATPTVWTATWAVVVNGAGTGWGDTVTEAQTAVTPGNIDVSLYDDVGNEIEVNLLDADADAVSIDNIPPIVDPDALIVKVESSGIEVPDGSSLQGGISYLITSSITDPVDHPNDILENQFGDVSLEVVGLGDFATAITLVTDESTISSDSLNAVHRVTMPAATETTGSLGFQFAVSATDTIGNSTRVLVNSTFKFDGRPSLVADAQDGDYIEAGEPFSVLFTATDVGGVALIEVQYEAIGNSDDIVFALGDATGVLGDNTRTRALAIDTAIGDSVGPINISAVVSDNTIPQALITELPTFAININQPPTLLVLNNSTLVAVTDTVEIYEGDTLLLGVSATDENVADSLSISVAGTALDASDVADVTFVNDADPLNGGIEGISGAAPLSGVFAFEPGYQAVPAYALASGNMTNVTYSLTFTAGDSSSNDPDDGQSIIVTVNQAPSVPVVEITGIAVGGVAQPLDGTATLAEGQELTVDFVATDGSGELMTVSAEGVDATVDSTPGVGTVAGTLTYTPDVFSAGTFDLDLIASVAADSNNDGAIDGSDTASTGSTTLAVTVTNTPSVPVLSLYRDDENGESVALESTFEIDSTLGGTVALFIDVRDGDDDLLLFTTPTFVSPPSGVTAALQNVESGVVAGVGEATATLIITYPAMTQNATVKLNFPFRDSGPLQTGFINVFFNSGDNVAVITADPTAISAKVSELPVTVALTVVDSDGDAITVTQDSDNATLQNELQVGTTYTAELVYDTDTPITETLTVTATSNGTPITLEIPVTVTPDVVAPDTRPGIVATTGIEPSVSSFMIRTVTGDQFSAGLTHTIVSSSNFALNAETGDLDGDGIAEVIISSGTRDPARGPSLTALGWAFNAYPAEGATKRELFAPAFQPYSNNFNPGGELRMIALNLCGDAKDEIVYLPGTGSPSRFRITGLKDGKIFNSPYNLTAAALLGGPAEGVIAVGADVDGDGYEELVVGQRGPGYFNGNRIQVMNITNPAGLDATTDISANIEWGRAVQIWGPTSNPSGAMRLSAGDIDGDGDTEVIAVSARTDLAKGSNKVQVLEPVGYDTNFATGTFTAMKDGGGNNISFIAFSSVSNPNGGIYVDTLDVDDDGVDEILLGRDDFSPTRVTVMEFDKTQTGGGVISTKAFFATFQNLSPNGGTRIAGGLFEKK